MASEDLDYSVLSTQSLCLLQSVRPIPLIHSALSSHSPTLRLRSAETPMQVPSS